MKKLVLFAVIAAFVTILSADGTAQTKTRVRFARGAHSATVKATIRGYAYRDYIVGTSAGQTINVSITGTNSSTVFTIFRPDGTNLEEAAETDGYRGELDEGGDYVIRVGMMRSAARRGGSTSTFSLIVTIR